MQADFYTIFYRVLKCSPVIRNENKVKEAAF